MSHGYYIVPSVTDSGEPQFTLYHAYMDYFQHSIRKIAENKDRDVLEKAIEHLTQGKSEEKK